MICPHVNISGCQPASPWARAWTSNLQLTHHFSWEASAAPRVDTLNFFFFCGAWSRCLQLDETPFQKPLIARFLCNCLRFLNSSHLNLIKKLRLYSGGPRRSNEMIVYGHPRSVPHSEAISIRGSVSTQHRVVRFCTARCQTHREHLFTVDTRNPPSPPESLTMTN